MKLGIYIHIPFCKQKCYYCDFPSYAGKEACQDMYLDALLFEIRKAGEIYQGRIVDTVFFGGGTPSVLQKEASPHFANRSRSQTMQRLAQKPIPAQ